MNVISIEEKAYGLMKQRFEMFIRQIEELCGDAKKEKHWMDGEEVHFLLDIQKRTLQYYRDTGKLPFSRIGHKCYYKTSDIQQLISESQINKV